MTLTSSEHDGSRIFLILLVFCIAVIPEAAASFTSEYGQYQDDPSNRGFIHDEYGLWESLGITVTTGSGSTISAPLVLDVDDDGDKDVVVASGNFINIYDEDLNLVDQFNFGVAPTTYTFSPDFDNNGYPELHTYSSASDIIYIYEYNSSGSFVNVDNFTTYHDDGNESKILCKNLTGADTDKYCYILIDNGTNDYVHKWNLTNLYHQSIGSMNAQNLYPAAADIDRDGSTEIIFVADDDGAGDWGIIVVDENSSDAGLPYLDTGFSSDGIIDNIASSLRRISSPMAYNIDGGGDVEIIIAGQPPAVSGMRLFVYDSSGGNYGTFPYDTADIEGAYPALSIATIDGDETGICVFTAASAPGGNTNELLDCVDSDENLLVRVASDFNDIDTVISGNILSIDLDEDGYDEIVTPRGIYDPSTNTTDINLSLNGYILGATDIDGDNNIDLFGTQGAGTRILFSNFSNSPPTLNNSYSYGGYFGYHNPVCVNTTVTYRAQEAGGTETGNYDNDASTDTERLVTNCGFDSTGAPNTNPLSNRDNGTYAGSAPTFDCYYNQTGTFPVRIYLQDSLNDADNSQYNTQTISLIVIDGQEGVTCNNPGTYISEVGDQDEEEDDPLGIDDDIDATLGILTGTSTRMRTIAGLAITLGIAATVASMAGAIGFAGGAILGAAIVTFIGLIPAWIFILVLIAMCLLIVLSRFITSTTPQ